jgi:hypothetical protein
MNLDCYITRLFTNPQMLRMGHGQSKADLNLGLGWLYYALARALRPERAVVIGSLRGFVPSVIARGLLENDKPGTVEFIDPSLVDDFWTDPERVAAHFAALGTPNVRHHRHTTQAFVETPEYAALADIGLLMVDGYHTAEQARFDYLAFLPKLHAEAVVMFHDSTPRINKSTIYGEDHAYCYTVHVLIERLRQTPGLQVFALPIFGGVTLVSGQPETLELINIPFEIALDEP